MTANHTIIPNPSGRDFGAYKIGDGPVIIVLQEIFGVNEVMRETCAKVADHGYTALCPDLFHQFEPGIELDDHKDEGLAQAFDYYKRFDVDRAMSDIAATIKAARTFHPGKVGAMGFCLGGYLAYRTATDTDIDASVGFYGVGIQDGLDKAAQIKAPLLLHIAGQDEFVPPAAQTKMHEGLDDHDHVTLHDYPDRDHAFARLNGLHFHQEDAETAWSRTFDFFQQHLGDR